MQKKYPDNLVNKKFYYISFKKLKNIYNCENNRESNKIMYCVDDFFLSNCLLGFVLCRNLIQEKKIDMLGS